MTKYVLNSGGVKNNPASKKEFHREIVRNLGNQPKFLLCNFGQGRENWEAKFPGYCDSIREDMPSRVEPSFTMAMPDDFVDQCQDTDIVYMHGGDDHLIRYWLSKFDLQTIFADKIVAANSGSSAVLCSSFWPYDWRVCMDGLSVLPIKFFYHFRSEIGKDDPRGPIDWQAAYDVLEKYGEDLPIHALEEGHFVVIEQ